MTDIEIVGKRVARRGRSYGNASPVTGLEAEVHQLRNLPLASDDPGQERADALGLRSGEPTGRGV